MKEKPITVLLVDDHDLIRKGFRIALEVEEDMSVVAEAKNGREAVELAKKFRPDVIVMDISMPIMNGLEATRKIMKVGPPPKILIISAHSEDEYIDQMIAMGARGYLIKHNSAHLLVEAIREVKKGNTFFSADIAKRLEENKNRANKK